MVGDTGLEPVTSTMSTWHSNQAELIAHNRLIIAKNRMLSQRVFTREYSAKETLIFDI
jgi:hypothetical protein